MLVRKICSFHSLKKSSVSRKPLVVITSNFPLMHSMPINSNSENENAIFDAVLQGEIDFKSPPWPSISNSAKDLVKKMLTHDPKKRITAARVLGKYYIVYFFK